MEIRKRADVISMKKGMSLSLSMIVILIIAVMVLAAILYFFFIQTGGEMTKAEANSVFYTSCQNYKSASCDWSVTTQPGFDKFLKACKFLFGNERDSFSCLYAMCADCSQYKLDEVQCAGMCEICKGNQNAGVETESCCTEYAGKCTSTCSSC